MNQLSAEQLELVSSLANRLGAIRGIKAVVLGGSHGRGRARPGSDIDLGLLYSEAAPFSIQSIRELAGAVNDTAGPRVQKTPTSLGASAAELVAAVQSIAQLARETVELTGGLYQARYTLPK